MQNVCEGKISHRLLPWKTTIALFVSLVNYILVLDLIKIDKSPEFFFYKHKQAKSFVVPILLLFN